MSTVSSGVMAAKPERLDSIVVIGSRSDGDRIPGSAQVISPEDVTRQNPFTINEALRQVPGLHMGRTSHAQCRGSTYVATIW
jgi:outer membrane receptor for Fe3+-dicitrate